MGLSRQETSPEKNAFSLFYLRAGVSCKRNAESQIYPFISCSFVYSFQTFVLNVFRWAMVPQPISTTSWLIPSSGEKKILWLAISGAFFWNLSSERNNHLFNDSILSFDNFIDLVFFTTLYWCRGLHPFKNYSLTYQSHCLLGSFW